MDKQKLYDTLRKPESLNDLSVEELRETSLKYPYFQTPILLLLKKLSQENNSDFRTELSKKALFCADRKKLFYIINESKFKQFLSFYSPEVNSDRTAKLLDSFLNSIDEENVPDSLYQSRSIPIISTDYLSYLEFVEDKKPETEISNSDDVLLEGHALIDSFIEKASTNSVFNSFEHFSDKKPSNQLHNTDNEVNEDEFLTETLAKIYIKQKKYEQALTIIKRLSLSFPKKSAYFADQIRFLEYLIINEKNNKKT